jgi:hypothetical protein
MIKKMYRLKTKNIFTIQNPKATCIVTTRVLQRRILFVWVTLKEYELEKWN